jgi:hypothetical protein
VGNEILEGRSGLHDEEAGFGGGGIVRRPKNRVTKLAKRPRNWKAGDKVYEPSERQIAAACKRIQRGWAKDDPRISEEKRPTHTPVEPVTMRFLIEAFEQMRLDFAHL